VRRAGQFGVNGGMDFSGLTDLPERSAQDCARCRCGSLARVASGLCASCLLRSGLDSEEANVEDFDALLAAVDVPDRDWQLGNYRILEEIGRGGMGVIYRARHAPSRRIVALKRVLNYHSDSGETLVRFQREARAAASLDHPNILPIYDVGATDDGLPFFSMKLAPGGSLLDSRETFRESPRRAVQLIASVARAIDHAHNQGILHRDLKPGNILLDARGEPMVSDFGLAKWLDTASELTCTLTVFGTPGYIAPEQAENAAADLAPAADVYSLGAILFELLAGRPPFLGEHAVAVIRQAADNDAPKLRSIVSTVPRDLETICARCLERDPTLRYQSAAALADELDRWLEGRPVIARPVSLPARGYRWSRRNPVLAISLAVCLFFAAAVITRQVQTWKLENKVRENELVRNSVAVLPFLDLDSAMEESGWTATLAQALQTEFSGIGNARVVPVGKGEDVKMAARNLRTRTVLSGTRRTTDHGMQVSVQLIDRDGESLFERIVDLSPRPVDLKPFAKNLAPTIYSVLAANDRSSLIVSKRDPGLRNEQARELIVAGREFGFHDTVRDFDRARSCFEKALRLEPGSVLAHAYLASATAARTHYIADPNLLSYAEREVQEALRLAPNSGEALCVLAGVNYQKGQLKKALAAAFRAIETNPADGMSVALLGRIYYELGRPDQALRWFQLARIRYRHGGEYDSDIGDCWAALHDFEKARIAYQRAIDLHPERSQAWIGMARLYLLNAEFAKARSFCRQNRILHQEAIEGVQLAAQIEFFSRNFTEAQRLYRDLKQTDQDGGGAFYGNVSYGSALGRLGLVQGHSSGARTILEQGLTKEMQQLEFGSDNPGTLYRVSAIESSLGRNKSALEHLEAAVASGCIDYGSLSLDPRFDNVADDVRFQRILGRLKLKVEDLRRAITDQ
jgi:tetratricopeptide (TPR) repeat protein/TolB-like protein/tRNA A-37 threonylcarbamoyl transferase component Bud32